MLFPLRTVNPTQLSWSNQSASSVLNYGPGNMYVYRSAAVNRLSAYDGIIGAGGTFQWPGGELWAVADANATTCNVLAGASAVNTGSTAISGTVTTIAAGGSGGSSGSSNSAVVRAGTTSAYASSGASVTLTSPSGTQAGDLLIAFVAAAYGDSPLYPSGWGVPVSTNDSTNYITYVICTHAAGNADAAGGASYTFSGGSGNAPVAVVLYAIGNATTFRAGQVNNGLSSATTNIQSATVNTGVLFIASMATSTLTDTYAWGSSPPNPAPAFTTINKTTLVVASAVPAYTVANPYTINVSGNTNTRDLITCAVN